MVQNTPRAEYQVAIDEFVASVSKTDAKHGTYMKLDYTDNISFPAQVYGHEDIPKRYCRTAIIDDIVLVE